LVKYYHIVSNSKNQALNPKIMELGDICFQTLSSRKVSKPEIPPLDAIFQILGIVLLISFELKPQYLNL